jgi:hypothetical protein
VRFSIWSVADFFISFSDNIQETFGLTPIEAMAAGLPSVVTDWNGYKDSVRHGEDGFRISTVAPGPGMGSDLAYWFTSGWMNYSNYVGAASQYVAVDYKEAVGAITALVMYPDLRRRMGEQARARAKAVFDWAAIVPQYQALWAEQDARRRAAPPVPRSPDNPFRPDPFRLFAAYPTRNLELDDQLALAGRHGLGNRQGPAGSAVGELQPAQSPERRRGRAGHPVAFRKAERPGCGPVADLPRRPPGLHPSRSALDRPPRRDRNPAGRLTAPPADRPKRERPDGGLFDPPPGQSDTAIGELG